jgi:hypothetical protein
MKERNRGHTSFFAPYLALDGSGSTRIPAMWAKEAVDELQGLPPYDLRGLEWYDHACFDHATPTVAQQARNPSLGRRLPSKLHASLMHLTRVRHSD